MAPGACLRCDLSMTISLAPEQEVQLQAHVQTGKFASVEEAVRLLVDGGLSCLADDADNMVWAKPLVDEAREGPGARRLGPG